MRYILTALTIIVLLSIACGIVALRHRRKFVTIGHDRIEVYDCKDCVIENSIMHYNSYSGVFACNGTPVPGELLEVCDENNPKVIKPKEKE